MVKVLFTQTRVVQDGTGTTFTAGEVYDLPVPSAERWKRRGVAVDAPEVVLSPVPEDGGGEWYEPGPIVYRSPGVLSDKPVYMHPDGEVTNDPTGSIGIIGERGGPGPVGEPVETTKRRGRPPKTRTE